MVIRPWRTGDEALACANRALDIIREGSEQFRLASIFETIAHIHAARGDHHSAVQYYRDALDTAAKTQTTRLEVALGIELGKQLVAIDECDEAIAVWRQTQRICASKRDPAASEVERLLASAVSNS